MTPLVNKKVILKKTKGAPYRPNHPWIYKSQISSQPNLEAGELVDVYSDYGKWIGTGYCNPASEITVRILTRREEPVDALMIRSRIERSLRFRERFVKETNAYRVISSEADEMPGLIVDRYGDVLVVQFLTAGMERLKSMILESLNSLFSPKGIYEKSDSSSRRLEGLPIRSGWIEKNCGDEVTVLERDIRTRISFGEGHKTGFYLDQRENRLILRDLGIQGRVLDAFCYSGGFGLHLAAAGCEVLGIDIQEESIALAEENRKLNNLDAKKLQFKTANVFDELKNLENEKQKFDCVILDPPSFVKKKNAVEGAIAGYKEIILRSMKLLNEEGLLAVFSCSYHVDETLLLQIALSAALDVRKKIKILKFLKQSSDHPIDPFIPETYYLKGFVFSVTSL